MGNVSYPGNDSATFLEHHRAVTKRWAERLRFERGTNTAGFMLFATECWFSHSYDAATVKPYPVLDAVRDAYAPVGLALETGRRHFFTGRVDTGVFISNDSDDYTDLPACELEVRLLDRATNKELQSHKLTQTEPVRYGDTLRVPVSIPFNYRAPAGGRKQLVLELRLLKAGKVISSTRDYVEVFSRLPVPLLDLQAGRITCTNDLGPEIQRFYLLYQSALQPGVNPPQDSTNTKDVWLLGRGGDFASLKPGGAARAAIEDGATAIVFSPGEKFNALFPSEIQDVKNAPGEFADFAPCAADVPLRGKSLRGRWT